MNKRIKELKSQCWDERPYGPPWFNSDKFAELIIKECIEVANKNRTVMEIKTNTQLTADAIKEHFGVEE